MQIVSPWEALNLPVKYMRHSFVYISLSSDFYAQHRLILTKLEGKDHLCAGVWALQLFCL